LRNVGACSADDLRISISHSETACVAWQASVRHWVDIDHGTLNPRRLAARESVHPGENILDLAIPIVQATPFPFSVAVKSWIRDSEPREQHLIVEAAGLKAGELRPFAPRPGPAISSASQGIPCPTLAYPEDEMAEALLSTLARHPKPDEYGITEILAGNPADPTQALYLAVPGLTGAPRRSPGDGPIVFPSSFGFASYYGLAGAICAKFRFPLLPTQCASTRRPALQRARRSRNALIE